MCRNLTTKSLACVLLFSLMYFVTSPVLAASSAEKDPYGDLRIKEQSFIAYLRIPEGQGPFPVIILSPGKGGLESYYHEWSIRFLDWGFASIGLDHYTPRGYGYKAPKGIPSTSNNLKISQSDIVATLKIIKENPALDTSRITTAGWSAGTGFVLSALLDKKYKKKARITEPFKSAVLFYPYSYACNKSAKLPGGKMNVPLILLIGTEDKGLTVCWAKKVKRIKSKDHTLVMKVYEGAYHAFDGNIPAFKVSKPVCRPPNNLCFKYDEATLKKSINDLKTFLNKYSR